MGSGSDICEGTRVSRHEEGERDLAIWDVLIASALLFPYEIEPEWPSWGYHWVCTTVRNLHVFAVVQICGVLCFEAGV